MIDTMYEYSGVGLAAPQVHEGLRVFVAMLDATAAARATPVTFVNPEITSSAIRRSRAGKAA
jgi:peptide deformylase